MKKNILKKSISSAVILGLLFSPFAQAQDAKIAKEIGVDIASDAASRTAGQKPDTKTLEGGIWAEMDKAELKAKTSGERTKNKALEDYVATLCQKLIGPQANDLRVYVMERPYFNATMAPNGYTEVWTGLMLRAQTEDELAFVLGHEAGHFVHSHSFNAYQTYKDRQNTALAFSILISVATTAAAANASSVGSAQNISNIGSGLVNIVYLGTIAAFFGYSREKEAMADLYGQEFATKSGFDSRSGEYIWQNLLAETQASDYEKVRKSPTRTNIFGSHPLETERVNFLKNYREKAKLPTIDSANEISKRKLYREKIRPYLNDWLKDDLRRRDYGQTIHLINKMSEIGEDLGLLNYYKGEAYRQRDKAGDSLEAINAYNEAVKHNVAPPETYRQLGEVYRKNNNKAEAITAFKKYIEIAPNAEDAWIIEDLISQLSKTI